VERRRSILPSVQALASERSFHEAAGRISPARRLRVSAPTLLTVGADDELVIGIEPTRLRESHLQKDSRIVPGASHLFEESGTLQVAATLARNASPAICQQRNRQRGRDGCRRIANFRGGRPCGATTVLPFKTPGDFFDAERGIV